MALEGSLDSFGLTDVLSLLSMTNKTGDLRLQYGGVTGYVRLRDGLVVAASSDAARPALARQLAVSGLIPEEALEQVASAAVGGDELASALAAAAGIDAETVAALCHEQVLSAVFELLRWPEGDFSFDTKASAPTLLDASLTVAQALEEAAMRLAGWPALTARIPDMNTVLAVTVAFTGGSALTPSQWSVLALFDGHRTIGEGLMLSTSAEWETLSLLAELVERGLLIPVDHASSAAHRAAMLNRLGLITEASGTLNTHLAAAETFVEEAVKHPSHGSAQPTGSQKVSAGYRQALSDAGTAGCRLASAEADIGPQGEESRTAGVSFESETDTVSGVNESLLQHLMSGASGI